VYWLLSRTPLDFCLLVKQLQSTDQPRIVCSNADMFVVKESIRQSIPKWIIPYMICNPLNCATVKKGIDYMVVMVFVHDLPQVLCHEPHIPRIVDMTS
jgi:hypothetical protein